MHWLLKSEAEDYAWQDLGRERRTVWDGVRNAEARKNLARMRVGERAFFYHSGSAKEIVGIAKVVRASFPDPADERWLAVEIAPAKALRRAVTLAELRTAGAGFAEMPLLTRPRLSVQPVELRYWNAILAQAEKPAA